MDKTYYRIRNLGDIIEIDEPENFTATRSPSKVPVYKEHITASPPKPPTATIENSPACESRSPSPAKTATQSHKLQDNVTVQAVHTTTNLPTLSHKEKKNVTVLVQKITKYFTKSAPQPMPSTRKVMQALKPLPTATSRSLTPPQRRSTPRRKMSSTPRPGSSTSS